MAVILPFAIWIMRDAKKLGMRKGGLPEVSFVDFGPCTILLFAVAVPLYFADPGSRTRHPGIDTSGRCFSPSRS